MYFGFFLGCVVSLRALVSWRGCRLSVNRGRAWVGICEWRSGGDGLWGTHVSDGSAIYVWIGGVGVVTHFYWFSCNSP